MIASLDKLECVDKFCYLEALSSRRSIKSNLLSTLCLGKIQGTGSSANTKGEFLSKGKEKYTGPVSRVS